MGATRYCKKHAWVMITSGGCLICNAERNSAGNSARDSNKGKSNYGRGSTCGGYGRSSYSHQAATFDGQPALKRTREDGATEFFFHPSAVDPVDLDDRKHGHAVIKGGKLVYKRLPGQQNPVVNRE